MPYNTFKQVEILLTLVVGDDLGNRSFCRTINGSYLQTCPYVIGELETFLAGLFVSDNAAFRSLALKVFGFVVRIGFVLDQVATGGATLAPC
jgi:hypothetical protein